MMLTRAGAPAIIQFAAAEFFCLDSDGFVEVTVIRIVGSDSATIDSVEFTTQNYTAVAGVHFEQVSDMVLFAPGEWEQKIRIPITLSPVWQPMLRFNIRLILSEQAYTPFSTCTVCIVHSFCSD